MSKPVLGLIGTIGAGKSAAAAALALRGGYVIDADRIGHEVLEEDSVRERLMTRWGERILYPDGRINRRAIAGIVFSNADERNTLESIVYPAIEQRCRKEIDIAQRDKVVKFVVLDAAVMLEAGWTGIVSKYLFIDAPRALRLRRVAKRGWNEADLVNREAAQWPADVKKAIADVIVVNDGSLEELQQILDQHLSRWELL